jgi:hypothetical protein
VGGAQRNGRIELGIVAKEDEPDLAVISEDQDRSVFRMRRWADVPADPPLVQEGEFHLASQPS